MISRGDAYSDGLIEFLPDPSNSSEGTLIVAKLIDREAPEVIDRNGILTFTVRVTDAAGNLAEKEVGGQGKDLFSLMHQAG